MILWPVVAFIVLALAVGTVRYGLPALDHRKHAKALTRIAVLERDLGIGQRYEPMAQYVLDVATSAAADTVPNEARVLGQCESCKRRVVLNVGWCHGGGAKCAKNLWQYQGGRL